MTKTARRSASFSLWWAQQHLTVAIERLRGSEDAELLVEILKALLAIKERLAEAEEKP